MAWTYSDYESQSTASAKLARLELHIAEVSAEINIDYSISGRSVSRGGLIQYLDQLRQRQKDLQRQTYAGSSGGSGFTRGRCL